MINIGNDRNINGIKKKTTRYVRWMMYGVRSIFVPCSLLLSLRRLFMYNLPCTMYNWDGALHVPFTMYNVLSMARWGSTEIKQKFFVRELFVIVSHCWACDERYMNNYRDVLGHVSSSTHRITTVNSYEINKNPKNNANLSSQRYDIWHPAINFPFGRRPKPSYCWIGVGPVIKRCLSISDINRMLPHVAYLKAC